MPRKRLDVRLPEDLDAVLRARAAELDRSITWVVEQALRRELGVQPGMRGLAVMLAAHPDALP